MKTTLLVFSLWFLTVAVPAAAQTTKLKVACPTTVGSMAVGWMTQSAVETKRAALSE